MKLHIVILAFLFGAFAAPAPAASEQYASGDIRIDHPWARATIGQLRVGAAYLSVENRGTATDRLIGASSSIAGRVELHTHVTDGNVVRMRSVPSIEIPAGGGITFEPGGMHIMLTDLEGPLVEGERFPLTLCFEKSGEVTAEVQVRSATARGDHPAAGSRHKGHGDGHHHGHGHGQGHGHDHGR